ncbi:MAG TPA: hypothetical protein VE985_06920 [Gaiellaceae bacterium]|nr:hypothetical protein [Gaiellaceae bacterium]
MQNVGVQAEKSTDVPSAPAVVPSDDLVFDDSGFVDFAVAGTQVSGEFRCTDCGYGAVVQRALPQCPMCGGTVWERLGPLVPRLAD